MLYKKKLGRKPFVSAVIALIMVLALIPGAAFAANGDGSGGDGPGGAGASGILTVTVNGQTISFNEFADKNVGESLTLKAEASGIDATYHFHWKSDGGKTYFALKSTDGQAVSLNEVLVSDTAVAERVKPNGKPHLQLQVIEGSHDNCSGVELTGDTVNVAVNIVTETAPTEPSEEPTEPEPTTPTDPEPVAPTDPTVTPTEPTEPEVEEPTEPTVAPTDPSEDPTEAVSPIDPDDSTVPDTTISTDKTASADKAEAVQKDNSAETGDDMSLGFYFTIMLAAMCGIIIAAVTRKRVN